MSYVHNKEHINYRKIETAIIYGARNYLYLAFARRYIYSRCYEPIYLYTIKYFGMASGLRKSNSKMFSYVLACALYKIESK